MNNCEKKIMASIKKLTLWLISVVPTRMSILCAVDTLTIATRFGINLKAKTQITVNTKIKKRPGYNIQLSKRN